MLYLVATPIGNLADITYRAVETLKGCDIILCEDTRHSRILLRHYAIDKPLKSFHMFNEKSREDGLIQELKEGKTIALISDAGTPGISDPGERLVRRCVACGIRVEALPGPCSLILGVILSGFPVEPFQFCGFLPRRSGGLKTALTHYLAYEGTTVCFETANRLLKTLPVLHILDPERPIAVARELTKKFEDVQRGSAQNLIDYFTKRPPKGEVVLVISQPKKQS